MSEIILGVVEVLRHYDQNDSRRLSAEHDAQHRGTPEVEHPHHAAPL